MSFFFFNDTATTEIYTLSLHDALPISSRTKGFSSSKRRTKYHFDADQVLLALPVLSRIKGFTDHCSITKLNNTDRKSTRLNSSHANISYAVFCLKKKKRGTKQGK